MKIVTSWDTLIRLSAESVRATASGDAEAARRAFDAWKDYETLCLMSDEMLLPMRHGDL